MESPIIATLPRGHHMDRQFGVVYNRAPAYADDLTQIDGVRTREAVLLNQMGIYLFGQVSLWRHREIVAIAGELQVPVSRIVDEGWTEQARELCRPTVRTSSHRSASILRTAALLACALLIGFLSVYFLGRYRNQALTGILSADITSIRVPAASRLTTVSVKPGDEVFSGQPLLTLEKLEHLALIENQERLVRDIERDLKRIEAQSAIELEWRTRDLDRTLTGVRLQVAQRESVAQWQQPTEPMNAWTSREGTQVSPISSRSEMSTSLRPQAGGIAFFSGISGQSSPITATVALATPAPQPAPIRTAMVPREGVVSDSPVPMPVDPQLEVLRSEQLRLETVRTTLPSTISEALGVTSLKGQFTEASQQLDSMKSVSREIQVQAPNYGVVGQVRFRQGDDLPAGEIMLRILHTDRRYVMLYLPTKRVNEMQPGHEVELRFPGNQEFRGQVVEIPMMADTTGETGETLAAFRIEPVGKLWPTVPVGSQIDVISSR